MHLDGDKEDVKFIEMIVKEMMFTINNKGFVLPEDIRGYLASLKNGEPSTMNGNGEEPVVLYTHKGSVNARTNGQKKYLEAVKENDIVFAIGPAGTGKTYLAVARAVEALSDSKSERIVLVRPAVEAGERHGFLPGDIGQKVDPYLRPLYDALYEMLGFDRVGRLLERGVIELAPLAYMRGRTLNEAFVILDEAQNTTVDQMKMFLTRIGYGSKVVVTGDPSQADLPRGTRSGLSHAVRLLGGVDEIGVTRFQPGDVVRHPLVQRIVEAYDEEARGADEHS